MTSDRILGAAAIVFGGFLLLYAIPANVRTVQGVVPYPAMFPQIAAWMFIGLGAAQMIFVKSAVEMPSLMRAGMFAVAAAATLAALLTVDSFGYLPVMITLMAAIVLIVRERRAIWVATVIMGLPIGIWVLFEQVLQRPLP
jgi:hypothetical protein